MAHGSQAARIAISCDPWPAVQRPSWRKKSYNAPWEKWYASSPSCKKASSLAPPIGGSFCSVKEHCDERHAVIISNVLPRVNTYSTYNYFLKYQLRTICKYLLLCYQHIPCVSAYSTYLPRMAEGQLVAVCVGAVHASHVFVPCREFIHKLLTGGRFSCMWSWSHLVPDARNKIKRRHNENVTCEMKKPMSFVSVQSHYRLVGYLMQCYSITKVVSVLQPTLKNNVKVLLWFHTPGWTCRQSQSPDAHLSCSVPAW